MSNDIKPEANEVETKTTNVKEEVVKETTENVSDAERIEEARNELREAIKGKVPAAVRPVVEESLLPMIDTLSENDARTMAKMIREKGLMGLLLAGKKKKKELEKNNADLTDGKV